ncbi:hypothetical protein [Jidongwangia harbinensis]|uniref:hypothetical protein n=1 Tax=Jidongwangia harbinensis TaxID=2878561 RepID=UPI001CD9EC2C|nr:hypothetical protein [Jidongwangia harbinensis]MCA2218029.1 hypothetical protein [Jidongwangia harbinensis]
MIVQLDEVRRLIKVGRVPQLRLAHILLDSAVELIMHRMVEEYLQWEDRDFDQLENLYRMRKWRKNGTQMQRRFANRLTEAELEGEIARLEPLVTSKATRRDIKGKFPCKVEFLVEKGALPQALVPVLRKLHAYRNETYHRDHHRTGILLPAVLIYFDIVCTVLDLYHPGTMIRADEVGPELARLRPDWRAESPFEIPHIAATKLREEVGLDLSALQDALADHLSLRLEELLSGLEYIDQNNPRRNAGEAIRLMQVGNDDVDAIFNPDVLLSRRLPITVQDIRDWAERAEALREVADRDALFAEFAALEDLFEPLERRVNEAVWQIDERANMRD